MKDNHEIIDNTPEVELGPLAERYMMLFGININLMRAIPFISDGLKPIGRRILYMVYKTYGTSQFTVGSAIGDVLHLSPHGDQGLGDIFARMAQDFTNNIPLLDTRDGGNSGNATSGNDAASPRYLQMNISKFSVDVFFSEFDGKSNMLDSYDGKMQEPFTLPAKVPTILLNGTSGIGVGLVSDILPYNLNEVINATIKLIKNPDAKIKLIPDSPTGCDIIVVDENHFIFQSAFDIDNVNYVITIRNTPYMEFLDNIIARLNEIQDSDNKIPEILSAEDESDLLDGEVKFVIRCKQCNLYRVINKLFKRVAGFRKSVSSVNMRVVDNKLSIQEYNPTQILLAWIINRIKEKRGWLLRRLVDNTAQYNILEGKAFMLSAENLNKTIKVCRSCNSKDEIIKELVEFYKGKVTSSQANAVADVPLYKLNANEHKKTIELMKDIESEIVRIRDIVNNPDKIKEEIINDMLEIKKKYGFSRRSKILNTGSTDEVSNVGIVQILTDGSVLFSETENLEHLSSDVTPINGNNVCLIDDNGGYLWVDTNTIPHDKQITMTSIGRGNVMGKCVAAVSNEDSNIILLTNKGRIKYMPISRIPSNSARKPLIPNMDNEHVVSVLEVQEDQDILIYTNDGMGKIIHTSTLNKVLSVDANGQYIMNCDNVSGMFTINTHKPFVLYVTKLGRIRMNHAKFLTTSKKFSDPKSIIPLSQQDDLIAVFCVDKNQTLLMNHADGRVSTVNLDSLEVSTNAKEPVKPKHVPGVKLIRATIK